MDGNEDPDDMDWNDDMDGKEHDEHPVVEWGEEPAEDHSEDSTMGVKELPGGWAGRGAREEWEGEGEGVSGGAWAV